MISSAKINNLKDYLKNFAFIFPAVAIFSIFYIYPFFDIFKLSLQSWDGIAPTRAWVGAQNFLELAGDKVWWQAMWHAFYITLLALTFQNFLSFALAIACDREMKMKQFYRVVFFIPPVISQVVVGLIWRWMFNAEMQAGQHVGMLNDFLSKVGLSHLVNNWLSNPDTALTCIAVVHCWQGFGWGFIILLAGLSTIDRQLYEAARVDGASAWNTFLNVTIPMMMPVILVVVILTILGSMQAFILVLTMTGQGLEYYTEVPVTRILAAMTATKQYGYACSMGVIFAAILVVISLTFRTLSNKVKQA